MRELPILICALELAQNAHTDFEIELPGNGDTGWAELVPSAPFEAVIPYYFSYGENPPGVFRLYGAQAGYTLGVKVIDSDELKLGVYHWLYATNRDSLAFRVENLDSLAHTCKITMWHLNVMKLEQLDLIRLVCWEYAAPGAIMLAEAKGYSPPFEHMPQVREFLKAKYAGLRW